MAGTSLEPTVTTVIQVTNIAPQATKDQMQTLFAFIGKIDDLRLYPSIRDASVSVTSRCCFVKFSDPASISVAQHLTNTVFIDRAIIVTPVLNGDVPDEREGLVMATQFQQQGIASGNGIGRFGGMTGANGAAVSSVPVATPDARLEGQGLLPYPVLPAGTPLGKVDEIRRTVTVVGIDSTVSAQACMEMFAEAGEVKYFRYCTRLNDPIKYALIEFTDQSSVAEALKFNNRTLGLSKIQVTHSIQAISKPQAKSSEAVQREIEEAMSKVKEAQSLVSAAVDPLMGMLGVSSSATSIRSSKTRSRSRSRSRRRSRSRGRSHLSARRSRSRERRRKTRSRSRDRKRSKSRERRRRSRSRDRKRSKRSRSRDRKKRSRSRDRKRESEKKDKTPETKSAENGSKEEKEVKEPTPEEPRLNLGTETSTSSRENRKRSRSRERKKKSRSRSREKKRHSRSRSRERKRRSASRERRRKRSRSPRKRRSRSKDRSSKSSSKVTRDYDAEEAMSASVKDDPAPTSSDDASNAKRESIETEDMEISNSP